MARHLPIVVIALSFSVGCSAAGAGEVDDFVVVPDGKADDFLSLSAREYVLSGRATITLEESYADATEGERLERVRELVGYKQILIAWFLTQYFIDKKGDDTNAGYGGFGAMAKANTYEELDIRDEGDGVTFSFVVRQLIAGPADLLQRVPTERNAEGEREMVLVVGKPSNEEMSRLETNHEWYRSAPWTSFDPDRVEADDKEELRLVIEPEVESSDAWFDYGALFEDGRLTIDVHFGWDYHGDYHVRHARSLFTWLTSEGFEAPVATFEELGRDSGPFTTTLDVQGRPVRVEVQIFYGKTGSETDPGTDEGGRVLEEDIRESLWSGDVIIYSGHSGPFYGFAMGNWKVTSEGDFDDSEMATAAMPEERYQLVVAEGCDTYHIGEAFRANAAKPDGRFIDIVTTTAPSDASTPYAVQDVIARLTERDEAGRHAPATVSALLRDLDSNSRWAKTMYGLHGIDDNPQLHPHAQVDAMCHPCDSAADCGGPGNHCVALQAGAPRTCAPVCTADAGCSTGSVCRSIASASSRVIADSVCTPARLACE
jgi:hypothetical protein